MVEDLMIRIAADFTDNAVCPAVDQSILGQAPSLREHRSGKLLR